MFKRRLKGRSKNGHDKRGVHSEGSSLGSDVSSYASSQGVLRRGCLKTPSEAARTAKAQRRLRVRFQVVHIREYERIIGDNPSCSSGAPIGYVLLLIGVSGFVRLQFHSHGQ
jgi:hypothetical protein